MECVVAFPVQHYVMLAHDGYCFALDRQQKLGRGVELESND